MENQASAYKRMREVITLKENKNSSGYVLTAGQKCTIIEEVKTSGAVSVVNQSNGIIHYSLHENFELLETSATKFNCSVCGKEVGINNRADAILCSEACGEKLFWQRRAYECKNNSKRYIIVDDDVFCIGSENDYTPNHCKGFGGAKFKIKLSDGEVVESTNLWSSGTIPEKYKYVFAAVSKSVFIKETVNN